jgi:hypothetical protein
MIAELQRMMKKKYRRGGGVALRPNNSFSV